MEDTQKSANYIEDVLADLFPKQAADEGDKDTRGKEEKAPPFEKKDKDDDKSKSEKGDKGDKDKDDDKGKDKEASTQVELFTELNQIHPELMKAANLEATSRVLADVKQAQLMDAYRPAAAPAAPSAQQKLASLDVPVEQARELFNAGYVDRLSKYAAEDPEFAQMLEEAAKPAFNAGFASVARNGR
jgi:hypothetical protein